MRGQVGAVPREHTSGRHEPRQLGRVVRLRLLGDGDARCSAATRRLPRLATDRYPDRMDRRRLLPTGFIEPSIPPRAHKPPSGPGWVHEVKHDGYQLIVRRDRAPVQPPRLCLDRSVSRYRCGRRQATGEFVHSGRRGGRRRCRRCCRVRTRSTGATRPRMRCCMRSIFWSLNGEDLRPLPLGKRKAKLAKLLARAQVGIVLNEHTDENGAVVFLHACRMDLEGIVSKRLASPYRSGPSRNGSRSTFVESRPHTPATAAPPTRHSVACIDRQHPLIMIRGVKCWPQ